MAESFADLMYDKITSVIGGNNPHQFFCMGLPGTLIDADQYKYDTELNGLKPAHVKANESKLVDKLFDACQMTGSDNGRHLSTQYKTALDVLTPKLNGKLFDAKNKLRKVLMTPYPYNFNDGKNEIFTIGQVFYRLFAEYVAEREEWAKERIEKQEELKLKYPSAAYQSKLNDEYLEWYGIVGEAKLLVLEEKLDKVLNVFSPGDMRIITGILDSGSGREIAEARVAVDNSRTLNPDGGYVYPVTLYPENWFQLLDTDFIGTDLLETPEALAQKLSNLIALKSSISNNIAVLMAQIPSNDDIQALQDAHKECEQAYSKAATDLGKTYAGTTVGMVKTLAGIILDKNGETLSAEKDISPSVISKIFPVNAKQATDILSGIDDSMTTCLEKQKTVITAAAAATKAALKAAETSNLVQLKEGLPRLQSQLEKTNVEIEDLKTRMTAALASHKFKEEVNNDSVEPGCIPDNFMKILISSSTEKAFTKSDKSAHASASHFGSSFFFGGYSRNSSHQDAVSQSSSGDKSVTIEIGMAVAKVTIGREWFNPGVFALSKDMYNTSSKKISPEKNYKSQDNPLENFSKERFDAMNECLFPCFPTAFVVARDVAIKFTTSESSSSSFASSVEDHSSSGGGFFCFSGSSSSSSSKSKIENNSDATADSVIVRFKNPQILGYYLEATHPDQSTTMTNDKSDKIDGDFISIFKFIDSFQVMLNDHIHGYHKETLNLK